MSHVLICHWYKIERRHIVELDNSCLVLAWATIDTTWTRTGAKSCIDVVLQVWLALAFDFEVSWCYLQVFLKLQIIFRTCLCVFSGYSPILNTFCCYLWIIDHNNTFQVLIIMQELLCSQIIKQYASGHLNCATKVSIILRQHKKHAKLWSWGTVPS